MNFKEVAEMRLHIQQVTSTKFSTAKELVSWMGAIKAQDYAMAKWAIGVRTMNSTQTDSDKAIDKGEIIRTHLLRPTWHFVSSADIYWMLELTAPQIRVLMRSRDKQLGLSESIYKKSNSIIRKAFTEGKNFTRDELISKLEKAKIATNEFRSGHFMLRAELDGIVCSGESIVNKPTYALLEQRVSAANTLCKEEALKKLALKYFMSHGPATLADFTWWSGLPVRDAKNALEMIQPRLLSETIAKQQYWFAANFFHGTKTKSPALLLPAFDEFLISYKDRTVSIALENHSKAFTTNGIFFPTIVVNGRVKGFWKRSIKKDKILIEASPLKPFSATTKKLVNKAAKNYGKFIGKKSEVIYPAD